MSGGGGRGSRRASHADGVTRRQAIGVALAGIVAQPASAFAADPDQAPLNALLAYQQQVVAAYDAALESAPGARVHWLEQLRRRARDAQRALRAAGATAPPPTATDDTLDELIAAEEALIASYYTALQNLSEERHLKAVAAFMADAGWRVVVLRRLAGKPLLPRAFETGGA